MRGIGALTPEDVKAKAARTLLFAANLDQELRKLTDVQLADLVLRSPLWERAPLLGVEGSLIDAMLDRLYRAKNGPWARTSMTGYWTNLSGENKRNQMHECPCGHWGGGYPPSGGLTQVL
jgi:hypothetical protein